MSARPYTSDGDSFGTRTLYVNDYGAMNSTYTNDYAYAGNDAYGQQDAYGTATPAYGNSYDNASYGNGSYGNDYGNTSYEADYSYGAYAPSDPYPAEYAYDSAYDSRESYSQQDSYRDRDSYQRQERYAPDTRASRRGSSPATGRIPVRRGGPPAVRQVSSTPLLLRATVVIGLVAAAGVGVFRAYSDGSASASTALTIGGTATTVAADTGATVQGSCRVQQSVTSRSQGRFTSVLTISNTSNAAVDGWTLTWSYPGTNAKTMPRLSDGWNATVSSDINGGQATAVDLSRVIPAGGSMTIGFVGTVSGKVPTPANFALNGVTCR